MNSLPMKDGTFLVAESSIGHIKRFDTDGNLVAYIGNMLHPEAEQSVNNEQVELVASRVSAINQCFY